MNTPSLMRRCIVGAAAAFFLAAPAAWAQGGKVTRLVVAFPPGG
jgi:hypothetical protein